MACELIRLNDFSKVFDSRIWLLFCPILLADVSQRKYLGNLSNYGQLKMILNEGVQLLNKQKLLKRLSVFVCLFKLLSSINMSSMYYLNSILKAYNDFF